MIHRLPAAIALAVLLFEPPPTSAQIGIDRPREFLDDPPAATAPFRLTTTAASPITFGRFTSIQVNVDMAGDNIVGDAANEPSIAVDPFDRDRMAIGWRQFDTIASNFREAGVAYSTDGGLSWTAGKIDPGVFRSDPVLGVDSDGDFFFLSLNSGFDTDLFASTDHGMTWGAPVPAQGDDKPWMTFDRTSGPGRDHVYQAWSTGGFSTLPSFNRSIDNGVSFTAPSNIPGVPAYGTLDVGPDGTVYVAGVDLSGDGGIIVARSSDAQGGPATPTFTTVSADLGGTIRGGVPPNPEGLLGQVWIAVDRSTGPRAGWVYVLASVVTPADPLDVYFIRSTDGGVTWSAPVRINDDPTGTRAHQWFGTMSVSPDGRIDVVWNDTRGRADSTVSALYYAYSTDGGTTWSPNEQASPTWDSMVGFPNQSKIGDYYHMVSDADGADLAYAATFNHEQDVYHLRLMPPMVAASSRGRTFRMQPNLPEPFRSATTIRFEVPAGGAHVLLEVFDCGGRHVATLVEEFRVGGAHAVEWTGIDENGCTVSPGIYLCRYQGPGQVATQKLVLLR